MSVETMVRPVRKGRVRMKQDEAFQAAEAIGIRHAADELRFVVERIERLVAEREELSESIREVMSEAKGRGYDTKALRRILALRRRDPGELAEEEAVIDLYMHALGMRG